MKEFLTFISLAFPISFVIVSFVAVKEKIKHQKAKKSGKVISTRPYHHYKRFEREPQTITLEELISRNRAQNKARIKENKERNKVKNKVLKK